MEVSPSEIGVGILTYKRPDYYRQVLSCIPRQEIGKLIIVNDGEETYVQEFDGDIVITNGEQLGVAKSKNKLLRGLIENGLKYLFLIEDDILIKDPKVFQHYIKAAASTGIHHLCFEKISNNGSNLKYVLEQPDGVKLGFYHHPQGAFMYVNANLVTKLGYFDENYINAYEHIDFAYNLIRNKLAPPFWNFPDLLNSEDYLTDIPGSNINSSITNKDNYNTNHDRSAYYFIQKWGHFTANIQDVPVNELEDSLFFIQQHYHLKKKINEGKKLSIVIPYRDRGNALNQIIPSLHEYVSKQVSNYEILVMEQDNNKPFNKGLLNNVGVTQNQADYYCFHDVDLLPIISDYSYPAMPSHISSHCSQFNYVNIPDKIMGGVILFNKNDYLKVNGYSNEYNGWGKEDDDLYERCIKENLIPYKHPTGRFFSVPHIHRLSNPVENHLHHINGKRFLAYKNNELGNNYHKQDGYSNCLTQISSVILKSKINNFKHYLVKF